MVSIRRPKNALKFSRPAAWWGATWREGLPTGNGIIGASVFGGAGDDVVMINHGDLWWQGHVGVLQDVADKMKDVRKHMEANEPQLAQDVLSKALITKNYRPQLYYPLPLCDFKISMPVHKGIKEYQRVLNMENGEVSVAFKDGATKYERSLFVSRAKNLVCYEITKSGSGSIDATFSIDVHDKFNARTMTSVSKTPESVNVKYENYFISYAGRSDNGTDFGAVAFINHFGGTQIVEPDKGIRIKGAEKIIVLIKPFIESQREKEWKNAKAELTTIKKLTYDKLMKEHTALHNKLWASADLDFGGDERDVFVDELIARANQTGSIGRSLLEKLWGYGRHLLICGAGTSGQPLSQYGLWCGDYKAQNSQINAFGTLQTMYSHAFTGNLADYVLAVCSYYENVLDDLKKNASRLYGCRGIMIPAVVANGTGAFGKVDSEVVNFTAATGWICQLFYNYYLYTSDVKFLKARALPFMREAVEFYEEFFKVRKGAYESVPSYSPFTTPSNYLNRGELKIARNASIDFAVFKELLKNLISGANAVGLYKDEIAKWEDMLTRIPDYNINADGTVSEYIDSEYIDNYESPSTAVYYPMCPGGEVNFQSADMLKSFALTAKKRYDESQKFQTAPLMSRYAGVFARAKSGKDVVETISDLVSNMCMDNLVFANNDWRGMGVGVKDTWAEYTLEANMGIASALQEMAVQSTETCIEILPAMSQIVRSGSVSGMLTKCGVEVINLTWDMKKNIITGKLKSRKTAIINLKLPANAKRFKGNNSGEKFNAETSMVENLSLKSGKIISIEIRM